MSNFSFVSRAPSHWLAFGLGLLLLAIAVPYTLSALPNMPLHAAHDIFPTSSTRTQLALEALADARNKEGNWLVAADRLEDALVHQPHNPLNWARLAYVRGEQGKFGEIGAQLTRSIETGAYIPGFMQWRLLIGLKYWPHLTQAEHALVANQALRLWLMKPNDFIRLARIPALAGQVESIMHQYHPDQIQRFLQRRRPLRHTR